MRRRGVCYDVGRVLAGMPVPANWRPVFDPREIHRELEIIRDDLHCNAVRICGQELERLIVASRDALELGLEVWFSPELWDRSPEETLRYLTEAAHEAEALRRRWPNRLVFSVGSELTLFMQGLVEGSNVLDRLNRPSFWNVVRSGAPNERLNEFLARAVEAVCETYVGPLTYASVPFETVDWSRFDIVSVDLYRDARIRDRFIDILAPYLGFGLPVAITEFGCCTYHGAADAGGQGFAIFDPTAVPPRLDGVYGRDEAEQANEVLELLRIFEGAGVDATFVFTFVAPTNPTSDEPRYDLDLASYALVKSYGSRLGEWGEAFPDGPWDRDRHGVTYLNMPWEPKRAFGAVADFYRLDAG
jgi:hypothetical protein